MLTWLGYIDGIHVTINIAAPWIRHGNPLFQSPHPGGSLPIPKGRPPVGQMASGSSWETRGVWTCFVGGCWMVIWCYMGFIYIYLIYVGFGWCWMVTLWLWLTLRVYGIYLIYVGFGWCWMVTLWLWLTVCYVTNNQRVYGIYLIYMGFIYGDSEHSMDTRDDLMT